MLVARLNKTEAKIRKGGVRNIPGFQYESWNPRISKSAGEKKLGPKPDGLKSRHSVL